MIRYGNIKLVDIMIDLKRGKITKKDIPILLEFIKKQTKELRSLRKYKYENFRKG